MTTICEDLTAPGLHALVIGVGRYGQAVGADASIAASAASALKIAEWLAKPYASTNAPLRSLELLLSPPAPGAVMQMNYQGNALPVEPAFKGLAAPAGPVQPFGVAAAIRRWFDRANAHADNVALFFFCGHGIEHQGEPHLLLEGFVPSDPNPFGDASLHVPRFVSGMEACAARNQLYLVDACRDTPSWSMAKLSVGDGYVVRDLDAAPHATARKTALVYSASSGERAGSDDGAVSRFVAAFLDVVEGPACLKHNGKYRVATLTLVDSMETLFATGVIQRWPGQTPQLDKGGKFFFHEPAAPAVPLVLRSTALPPQTALTANGQPMAAAGPGAWMARLPPGTTQVSVEVPGQAARTCVYVLEPACTEDTL